MRESRPSAILTALNQALARESRNDRFCTVLFVRVVANEAGARLTVCSGGHPLPMILRSDGTVERAGQPGTLLGVFPDAALPDSPVDLRRGDTLVLYTDGVTEERDGALMFGESGLRAAMEQGAGLDAQALAAALGEAVQRFRSAPPRDDMAILALRVRP
jgi:serine phosphatase RsbU (regulator of sigma subunit)